MNRGFDTRFRLTKISFVRNFPDPFTDDDVVVVVSPDLASLHSSLFVRQDLLSLSAVLALENV